MPTLRRNSTVEKKTDIERMTEDLLGDEAADRERLSSFFDKLLEVANREDADVLAVGECAAKIAEAMTRQSVARLNTIKILKKEAEAESDQDVDEAEVYEAIGRPFEEETGGN